MSVDERTGWHRLPDGQWGWYGDEPPTSDRSWRQALIILATVFSLMIVVPLAAVFFVYRDAANDRIADNKAAVRRERDLRVQFNQDLNRFIFEQCVAAEKRDTIIVKILALIEDPPPIVVEAIDALEPPGERDCTPPAAGGGP